MVATEEPDVPRHSGASSSSQHTAAASRVPTVLKLGSLGNSLWTQLADYEAVDSRHGIRETCADPDRETAVSTPFRSESKWKRDRDQNVVQSLNDRPHLHRILERRAELSVRREKKAQQKLYEAEAEVEAQILEKKMSDIALREINLEFESQRFNSYNKQKDGQIRLREVKSACMESLN